ncbi:MAG TPA: cupin domain-containing protein [Steroidobacteraceae bacterium]|nr:cupin domain-containing protein [Steroidobacteraceae bacterium]
MSVSAAPVRGRQRRKRARPSAKSRGSNGLGPAELGLGVRLKHARLVRGERMRDVARRADCSVSLISKIENDKVVPSLTLLHKLVGVLGINIGALFDRSDTPPDIVMRSGERPIIEVQDRTRGNAGVKLERVVPYGNGHLLQGNIHIVAPGSGSEGGLEHEGEEVGFVLQGTLRLTVDGEQFTLRVGDSFVFNSAREHSYFNPGSTEARVLWINTPPTF